MTEHDFNQFIDNHSLYSFDGLIAATLTDGSHHRVIWITTLPKLLPAIDGTFAETPEMLAFFLIDSQQYVVWHLNQIEKLVCIQEQYLQ